MKLVLDVADDIPLEKMQSIYDAIEQNYREYIVEMGWIVKGKFVKQLEEKEQKIKADPFAGLLGPGNQEQEKDPYEKLLGPKSENKADPFDNIIGSDKKEKKDDFSGLF